MALVTSLESNEPKKRQSVHPPTRCLYSIFKGPDGARYLQLDTVGSKDREILGKVSQSIQFDRQAAGQLLQLLRRAFPDLMEEAGQDSSNDSSDPVDEEDQAEAMEGGVLLREHRHRERVPKIVRRKKRAVMRAEGRLQCEVCDFDFAAVYGVLGNGFAECHHLVPLSELSHAAPTRLTDLAIVCANCHRMLHRRPIHTISQLRAIVQMHLAKTLSGARGGSRADTL